MLTEHGFGFHPDQTVDHIDPEARAIVLTGGRREGYDLLLGIPPHRAPAVACTTGLAAETGFLPVDPATLATSGSADAVFAIGDVTTIPLSGGKFLPKAGVFAEAQAMVVARNIAGDLAGHQPDAAFDGMGACFVELGGGRATGEFYASPGPQVRMRRPGRHWHWAKVAHEQYWMRRWVRLRRRASRAAARRRSPRRPAGTGRRVRARPLHRGPRRTHPTGDRRGP